MASDFEPNSGLRVRPAPILGGLIVVTVGTLLMLDRTGALNMHAGRLIGPIVLIVLGTTKVFERRRSGGGVWLIGLGAWMLVSEGHLWGLDFHNSWPLLIILMGVLMVFRGWR